MLILCVIEFNVIFGFKINLLKVKLLYTLNKAALTFKILQIFYLLSVIINSISLIMMLTIQIYHFQCQII